MVFKKACVFGLAVITLTAFAQGTFVEGARGLGRARSADGKIGYFRFEVARLTNGTETGIRGSWSFTNAATNPSERFEINLVRLAVLGVQGNVAELGGRAVLVKMGPNGAIRKEGYLMSRVEDRKQPKVAGDPDKYKFRFVGDNGGPLIEFDGLVTDGDLIVIDNH